jgi:hypothetical protein
MNDWKLAILLAVAYDVTMVLAFWRCADLLT